MKNFIIALCLIICMTACAEPKYEKYSSTFVDAFDTVTVVTGFEKSQRDFDKQFSFIYGEMLRLHQLYDIYNDYEGINNVKTINDNAGIAPVKADKDLIELIEFGIRAYDETNGAVNIALGSVLKVWHEYRQNALDFPESASIPAMEELKNAAAHTDINGIVIDKQAETVYLEDPEMSLDLGAIAKGYAVELTGKKARKNGFVSGIISAGGNIYTVGAPKDGRKKWSVGIQNPFTALDGEQLFDALYLNDCAIVSSGDYQRFYVVDGQTYHHIIDPVTLMPANRFSGVTILHSDSGIADMLSTTAFILPQEEGKKLIEEHGGEAIWIFEDKSYVATDGYKKISKIFGVTP